MPYDRMNYPKRQKLRPVYSLLNVNCATNSPVTTDSPQ